MGDTLARPPATTWRAGEGVLTAARGVARGTERASMRRRRESWMNHEPRIGVLMSGLSSERALSVRSGDAVHAALSARGHDVVKVFVDGDLDLQLRSERIDVAFLALRGRCGEDGSVQGLLEVRGIPYTGPSVLGAALALDKLKAKELFRLHNLPTPAAYLYREGRGPVREQHGAFGYPVVVKPRAEGSSLGTRRADDLDELELAIEEALRYDGDVLVERFVAGREIHVALLDRQVLGAAEVHHDGATSDFARRSVAGCFSVFCPPRISPERLRGIALLAERAAHALELDGLTEVDVMVSDLGNEQLLEIDAVPALAPNGLVARIARATGVDFGDLIDQTLGGARLHTRARTGHAPLHRYVGRAGLAGAERAPSEPH
jgi:D-alanine-D-alanine ligase